MLKANALSLVERPTEAKNMTEASARQADELVKRFEGNRDVISFASSVWNNHGQLLLKFFTAEKKGNPEAEAALLRTVELAESLVQSKEATPEDVLTLATARGNLAGAYRRAEKFRAAEDMYASARQDLEGIVRQYPENLGYKLELATSCNQIALLLEYKETKEGVEDAYRRTVELLEELTAKAPDDATLWARLGTARSNLGSPPLGRKEYAATEALLVGALDALHRAVALAPGNKEYFRELVNNGKNLAYVRRLQRDYEGAAVAVEELMREFPKEPYPAQHAAVQIALGVTLLKNDPALDEAERERLGLDFARRVAEAVREAIKRGGPPPPNPRKMHDFKSLHGYPPFEELADELEAREKKK
jgi:tetratricopeptide (TPR) repeat protein